VYGFDTVRRTLSCLSGTLLFIVVSASAQYPHWTYEDLTRYGYSKIGVQAAFDSWGNLHVVYGTENPRRSGTQLFYVDQSSGEFGTPIQMTDTGTILDSSGARIAPYVFRLGRRSTAHLVFAANVANRYNLYYVDNSGHSFPAATLLGPLYRYDMAVDSSGGAHVVWIDTSNAVAELHYWSSKSGAPPTRVANVDCFIPSLGCRLGAPEVEVRGGRIMVAFRSDSGTVNVTQSLAGGGFAPITRTAIPAWPGIAGHAGDADLRLRLAADDASTFHLLMPVIDSTGAQRMLYARHGAAGTSWLHAVDRLDTSVSDFELVFDGRSALWSLWTTYRKTEPPTLPRNTLAHIETSGMSVTVTGDLSNLVTPGAVAPRFAHGLALFGERLAVPVIRLERSDSATTQVGVYRRTVTSPNLKYLLPDAAGPGMSVVVDAVAAPLDVGAFGTDGFRRDTVAMELVNPADAARVLVGPTVISWSGRLASTMLFVRPDATPGPVPVRLRIQGVVSSVDTFFIVRPQPIGHDGVLTGGGPIPARRSRRGVMVLDSLVLRSGVYSIDTVDTDSLVPGNQGFLPITILCRGRFTIDSTASLSVSGWSDSARSLYGFGGPGGGGGGTGSEFGGGSGFTGGGGIVRGNDPAFYAVTTGTGGTRSAFWNGGPSLSGARGGASQFNVPGGGGTGHPFGSSGFAGRRIATQPIALHDGAFGGGSGGGLVLFPGDLTTGGGGGGSGAQGEGGGDSRIPNGGRAVGNAMLVPMAGGSGGGGGGFASGGYAHGGGGGGALAIIGYQKVVVDGDILAFGGVGFNRSVADNASGGGGGGGGSVMIGAQGGLVFGPRSNVVVNGGAGGRGNARIGLTGNDGGDGGGGRIRFDGQIAGDVAVVGSATVYHAAATTSSGQITSQMGSRVRGTGMPGSTIRLYATPAGSSAWDYGQYQETTVGPDGAWTVTLGSEATAEKLCIVVMQRVASPSVDRFTMEPAWVMSAAGGNIVGRPAIGVSVDTVQFGCIHFSLCDTAEVVVSNPGYQADLVIQSAIIEGEGSAAFSVSPASGAIPSGAALPLAIRFCPGDTGRFEAILTLESNAVPNGQRSIRLIGCGTSGHASAPTSIDIGPLCLGQCAERTIPIHNSGPGDLHLLSATSDDVGALGVSLVGPVPPLIIRPGASADIVVRLCPRRFEPSVTSFTIRTDGLDSLHRVDVRSTNVGPDPELPMLIDVGTVELGSGDSCVAQVVTIANRSSSRPLRIAVLELLSRSFRLIDTLRGDSTLAPGERLMLRVSFCPDSPGTFDARLRIRFGGESCQIDTAVQLRGHATLHQAMLVVMTPTTKTLVFSPTPLLVASPPQSIVVRNVGSAPGRLTIPVGRGLNGSSDASIEVDLRGVTYPYDLPPGDSVVVDVRVRPDAEREIEGVVLLASQDGAWSDSVAVYGRGTRPGLFVSLPRLDFGLVRVGDSSIRVVDVGNSGSASVTLERMEIDDSVHFVCIGPPILPLVLPPGGPPERLVFRFRPSSEGESASTARVVSASESQQVNLVGRGGMERAEISPAVIDFGCRPPSLIDSIDAIQVTNVGTWPLRIDSLAVDGDSDFILGVESWPHVLLPGARRSYTIRFFPTASNATARVVVYGSATERVVSRLDGRRCDARPAPTMSVVLPRASGFVGTVTQVPIRARMSRPSQVDINYEVEFGFDPRVLALPPFSLGAPVVVGTLSSAATADEVVAGRILIRGTIQREMSSDTLVLVPLLPLAGPSRTSVLVPLRAAWSSSIAPSMTDSGSFQIIACDSGGTVTIGESYALAQNHPNPFNPTTVISFSVAYRERARLTLYDNMGMPVRTLVDADLPAGLHNYILDGTGLASGVYYYELAAGRFRKMLRMVLLE